MAELRKYTENIEIIKKMIRAKTDGDGTKQNEFQYNTIIIPENDYKELNRNKISKVY